MSDEAKLSPTLGSSLHNKSTWRSGYCYLNKGECNLNQSKDDSFKRVAKNTVLAGLTKKPFGHYAILKLFPIRSPRMLGKTAVL